MLKSPLLNFKDLTCVPIGYTTILKCTKVVKNNLQITTQKPKQQ